MGQAEQVLRRAGPARAANARGIHAYLGDVSSHVVSEEVRMQEDRDRTTVLRNASRMFIVAGVLAIGGMLILGLPGALVLETVHFVGKPLGIAQLKGDQLWPAAILVTLTGPFALVPAYLAATQLASPGWRRGTLTVVVAFVANVAVVAVGLIVAA